MPTYQLLGVADLPQMRLYTNVFQSLGIGFAVVNSLDGYDEISLTGQFKVTTNGYERIFTPEEIGLTTTNAADLYSGSTPQEAARIFDAVLQGTATRSQLECVTANAAFAIQAIDSAKSIDDCLAMARESIASGKALQTLKKFIELNS